MTFIAISRGVFIKPHKESNLWTVHDRDARLEYGSHFNGQLVYCIKS